MDFDQLTEEERTAQVRQLVQQAEAQAFAALLSAAAGVGSEDSAKDAERQAVGFRKAAKAQKVGPPYLTKMQKHAILVANVKSVEQRYIEAQVRSDAGDEEADPAAEEARKEAVIKAGKDAGIDLAKPPEEEVGEEGRGLSGRQGVL